MTAMSDYLESQLITHLFRGGTYTKPTVLALALCTAAVSDTHTGALTSTEVANANGYLRLTTNVSPADANWSASSSGNGTTTNVNALTFASASGGDWSTITYVAVVDNSTYGSGNVLFYGSLTGAKVVSNGDTFQSIRLAA